MSDLSERFMETDAKSIDVDGRAVVQMYERDPQHVSSVVEPGRLNDDLLCELENYE